MMSDTELFVGTLLLLLGIVALVTALLFGVREGVSAVLAEAENAPGPVTISVTS